MDTVTEIIAAFGGVKPAAEKTETPQQTVSEWVNRTPPEIPPWRRPVIAARANDLDIPLSDAARAYLASTKRTPKAKTASC